MQINATSMDINVEAPQKTKNRPYNLAIPLLDTYKVV
jgi:hypothetical protein